MILSIITLVVLAGVAFFHYTQGLFNATVSAISTAIAAVIAFGFNESLNRWFGTDFLGSYGDAACLVALFAFFYADLRGFLDNFLPSNVRYPVAFDKVGAAVMGLVAGFFASGIIAIAAQMLPFGATAVSHAAYEVEDAEVTRSETAFDPAIIRDDALLD